MGRDPTARPDLPQMAMLRELLPRCRPSTVMAVLGHPRRSDRRVRAGQCRVAGWANVSTAAIDRADALMTGGQGVVGYFLNSLTPLR
jgi:hypothetical protein